MKTIIVDDDKQAALDLAERLKRFDRVEVVGVAQNGLDGLSLVYEHKPDLLFLDVQLPDVSGLDFLDKVQNFTHGVCRVVMFTSYDKYVLPAFRKKAFDVLLKPVDDDDLGSIMQRLEVEQVFASDSDGEQVAAVCKKQDGKFLFYTNTFDFKLVNKRDIGLFQYNHEDRSWEVVVAGSKSPIRLRRNLKSDVLVDLSEEFVQISQKFIINMNFLVEVVDNVCHFYPPFDAIDYVKVTRFYRRKLIDRFYSL